MKIRSALIALVAALALAPTCALAQSQIGSGHVMGNSTAAQRTPTDTALSPLFDRAFCGTNGAMPVRIAGVWQCSTAASSNVIVNDSVQSPVIAGGTGAASSLTIESTSGVGTSDAVIFKTGSQLERARIGTIGNFDIGTSINAQVGTTYTILSTDDRKLITGSNIAAQAYTLPQATGAFTTGWSSVICSYLAGTVTVTPTTSLWNGGAAQAIPQFDCYHAASNGTNYQGMDLGLYTRNKGDLSLVSANFSLLASGLGNQTNVTGNGTVVSANYFAPFMVANNYAPTHTGAALAAGSFSILGPGSGAAGGSGDIALTLSSQQLNYLTTSTAGENDGLIAFTYGGVNSTGNPITAHIFKRANGSSQVAVQGQAIETQADLVNGSAVSLGRVHAQINQLDVGNSKLIFGMVSEAQIAPLDTAYLGDTCDQSAGATSCTGGGNAPSWNYLARGRTARADANQYFAITGGGHASGSGRIASGVAAATITARAQFNSNTAAPVAAGAGTIIYAIGANGSNAGVEITAYGSGNFPFVNFQKSNGTLASRSTILAGDSLGQFSFGGFDGTNGDQTGAIFTAFAGENWTNAAHGTGKDFYSTPNGGTATAVAFRMNPSGGISIGTTTDAGIGALLANTSVTATTFVKTGVVAVLSLPVCGAGTKGARHFVNDNNTALAFAAVITTGGAIQTPVYCDGTVWRQG